MLDALRKPLRKVLEFVEETSHGGGGRMGVSNKETWCDAMVV